MGKTLSSWPSLWGTVYCCGYAAYNVRSSLEEQGRQCTEICEKNN